ncbi:hypothetical protein BGW80DRAFT_1256193 [Lactifluus volemus]|nr:hypothetical protein BGW80DRAFT_1256193 [Lactifluus volemus]
MSQTYGIGHRKDNLKLGRTGRQLFKVNISLDGPEVNPPPKEWSAKKREECLEKLKERLEGEKERRGRTGGGRARDGLGTRNVLQHLADTGIRASAVTPPLPTPLLSVMVLKPTEGPARKRSWRPFCIQGGAASVSSNGKKPFTCSVARAGTYYSPPLLKTTSTLMMESDADIGEREYGEEGGGRPTEVVPPTPLLQPVQFWLPGYLAWYDEDARPPVPRRAVKVVAGIIIITMISMLHLRLMPPPPPPLVFLTLGARCVCIPYTPAV